MLNFFGAGYIEINADCLMNNTYNEITNSICNIFICVSESVTSDESLELTDILASNFPGNVTLYGMINNSSDVMSSSSVSHYKVSPQSSSLTTNEYTTIQPVSPPQKFHFSNTTELGESSHYVGADGHVITLVNNKNAVDPTYEQLVEFIKEDTTNEIPYNNTSFVCSDVAERVHNNAEAAGFKCAWVFVDFTNECPTINPMTNALIIGHACNLFNTTDKGLIAIDCTRGSRPTQETASLSCSAWDDEVSLVKGGEYVPRLLYSFPGSDSLNNFLSMGTISDYYVFW
jgi:hypothetical protein